MKKYIIALAVGSITFMLNVQTSVGQGQRQRPDPKVQTDKMAQNLGLSDDQKAKVLVVNTDADQQLETLRSNKAAGGNFHGERQKIEQDKEAKLKTILTDDQFQKFIKMREERQQKRKERNQQKQ